MADKQVLLKEFEEVRERYNHLLAELVKQKIPGVFNPQASTCDHGTVCHGGGARPNEAEQPVVTTTK